MHEQPALALPVYKPFRPLSHLCPATASIALLWPWDPRRKPRPGEATAACRAVPSPALALPATSRPAARTTLPPRLLSSVSPAAPGPLLWRLWSVTSAQEAYKSTCVRHSTVQNNFQFTRNNYHPQIIACTQAGEEGWEGEGRQEARKGGRAGAPGRRRPPRLALLGLGFDRPVGGKRSGLPEFGTGKGFCPVWFWKLEWSVIFWMDPKCPGALVMGISPGIGDAKVSSCGGVAHRLQGHNTTKQNKKARHTNRVQL